MRLVLPAALVSLFVLGPGCAHYARGDEPHGNGISGLEYAARSRGASEMGCPADGLRVRSLGYGGYRVEGCGRWITYTCLKGGGGIMCSTSDRGVIEIDPSEAWSDEDVRMLVARIHGDIVACLPPGEPAVSLVLFLRADGRLARSGTETPPPDLARCVDARLASEHMGRVVRQSRVVTLEFRRDAATPRQALGGAPPAAPQPSPESAARAAIDGRAGAILACVGADALAVQVSWSSEGALDALLRGDSQGTPEEGCVRAIVQQLSIPRPGVPGSLVHALQR